MVAGACHVVEEVEVCGFTGRLRIAVSPALIEFLFRPTHPLSDVPHGLGFSLPGGGVLHVGCLAPLCLANEAGG